MTQQSYEKRVARRLQDMHEDRRGVGASFQRMRNLVQKHIASAPGAMTFEQRAEAIWTELETARRARKEHPSPMAPEDGEE